MIFSAMLKKLKKSLRRKIRWITLASILIVFIYTVVHQYEHSEMERNEITPVLAINEDDSTEAEEPKNTYFGIDDQGHLSLFDGDPETSQIIRTFFQLDIEYLESSLPHDTVNQLYEGILVSDEDEYNSVLSTFSPFAVEVSAKMLEPLSD